MSSKESSTGEWEITEDGPWVSPSGNVTVMAPEDDEPQPGDVPGPGELMKLPTRVCAHLFELIGKKLSGEQLISQFKTMDILGDRYDVRVSPDRESAVIVVEGDYHRRAAITNGLPGLHERLNELRGYGFVQPHNAQSEEARAAAAAEKERVAPEIQSLEERIAKAEAELNGLKGIVNLSFPFGLWASQPYITFMVPTPPEAASE